MAQDQDQDQDHIAVYAFGDQTFDATGLLSTLLLWDNAFVPDLVERTTRRLQQEIAELGSEQKAECTRFATLLDLVPYWKAGTLTPALCQALTCFVHVGVFLASHTYERGSKPFPTPATACLTGVCTGLLSAAAVSHSRNAAQLLPLGEEAIAVAFRLGALAANVGSRIAVCRDAAGAYSSWTAAVVGTNIDAIREQMNASDKRNLSTTYVSAHVSANQINISAAPHTLQDFLATLSASGCSSARLSVQAPYHAPHLYSDSDVEQALRPAAISQGTPTSQTGHIPVISSATGKLLPAGTFVDTLRSAIADCLLHAVRYDLLGPAIASHISSMGTFRTLTIQPVALGGPERLDSAIRANMSGACGHQDVESTEALLGRLQQQRKTPNKASRSRIAILSCAGRFPRASDMETLWEVLLHGVDTHRLVPVSRWDARTHVATAPAEKNVSRTGYGCWLDDASAFDAKFFSVSPREAPQMDPAQRLALMCAAEAMEEAGVVPGRTSSTQHNRIGVYFGVTSNDWMETNSAQNIDTYFIPGGNRAFIAGRVNYHFKFSGPSYSIDTACSSSLTAIQLACNALWRKEIDMAVVGGTNILTNPDMHCGLDKGHFLSRTGNCKTFDASADGYCRGEAVAVIVLKRLEDAEQDSDPVQACILSVATNHSADAESITRPHVGAQRELIDRVLREAGVSARSISYAEMHGTGTQAGDVAETNSVVESLAAPNVRGANEPLYIGSAKANLGHGEAAAGITSLAKVLLMLKHNTIPPHCGIKTVINPKMPDLKSRNTLIATERVSWTRPKGGSRRVLVNNFSAAGGNTALILEDPPPRPDLPLHYSKPDHTIVISAKTAVSLRRNAQAIASWIDQQDISDPSLLPRLAYTTTARRMHHPRRMAATGSDLREIKSQLQLSTDRIGTYRSKAPKILFAFSGQGSEFPRMSVDLYDNVASFRQDIEVYDRMCLRMGLPSILGMFKSHDVWDKATPQILQLAAVCLQMALVRTWRSFGAHPTILVGHSLGEYPALYAAGVLSQSDVIYLVGLRAAMMQEHCTAGSHAMLVVRSSLADIEALLRPSGYSYEVACVNGRKNVVLGGTKAELKLVHARLEEQGVQTAELPLPYAFHTSQADPILGALDLISGNVHFAKPKVPVISPTYAGIPLEFSSAFAAAHCRRPVQMYDALQTARAQGFIDDQTICIEIGPAAVTSKMIKEVLGTSIETFVSMRHGEHVSRPLSLALAALFEKGSAIEWDLYHQSFGSCQQILPLPAYGWDLQDYWMTYTNDWSLRKGDAPIAAPGKPVLQSASIHRVVVDNLYSSPSDLIVESDLNRGDFGAVVQGHKVYGVPLCTPSVYADIALTIGEHIKQHALSDTSITIEIAEMTIQSALVVISGGQTQILRTVVTLDRMNKTALCTFSSFTDIVKRPVQHGHCTLRFHCSETPSHPVARSLPNVFSRMGTLYKQLEASRNATYRFSKAMAYKMVDSVADFDSNYRGLAEVVMDNDALEATGRVEFQNSQLIEGDFNTHPACIDALSQLGGFVMNANESTDLSNEIFVNHGWRSLQIMDSIDSSKSYRSHCKMIEGSDKVWSGDVTIFDGEQVVARFIGIALQRVPRRLMEHVVNAAYAKAAAACGIARPSRSTAVIKASRAEEMAPRLLSDVSSFDAVMAIISSESGIPLHELTDSRNFDDLGVDSLLSLRITSRVRDELDIGLENSISLEFGNVGALRAYINDLGLQSRVDLADTVVFDPISPPGKDIWTSILEIVSQEVGIPAQDLSHDSNLADLGLDSLLALVISSRLQEELDIDLPHISLFVECETIGTLRARIMELASFSDGEIDGTPSESAASNSSSSNTSWPLTEVLPPEVPDKAEGYTARSLTLQGNTRTATDRLFLFPDGGGSATSYAKLPPISPFWAVVAFDSPFVRNPQLMETSSLAALLNIYLEALRKHQPKGPYHLGGWSAGGILAYALASKLIAMKEEVSTLILIDSPSPAQGLDRLPQSFFDHCASIGIFESEMNERVVPLLPMAAAPPQWLIPHFHATIELLHDYHALPLPRPTVGTDPRITIIWAGACAFENQKYTQVPDQNSFGTSEIEGISFLTRRRTDFGPGKWSQLLSGCEVTVHTIEDEHHFSMMRRGAPELARVIQNALGVRQDHRLVLDKPRQ